MNKEKELMQIEHQLNILWMKILDCRMKDAETSKETLIETMKTCMLLAITKDECSKDLLAWASLKFLAEARRRNLIPKQRMRG